MKNAQITENFLVYLCKLPFLKKVRKKLKKPLDFLLALRYNRQARKTRATSQRANCSLKIEQHEISSTEKCRDLVKTLWKKKLKQSKKEARENSSEKGISRRVTPDGRDIQFFREFDPGSGLTLAACITHSSRTECSNTLSGGRVSNAWAIYLQVGNNNRKQLLIPHDTRESHGILVKDLSPEDELASD